MGSKLKGNLADQLFISIIFLAFCITTIVAYTIWSSVSPALTQTLSQATPGGTISAGAALAITQANSTLLMLDILGIFFIMGTFIAIIISCFYLDTHPIFFIISFITFCFQFIIYAILGNVFGNFETNSMVQAAASNFPIIESFWKNIDVIALLFSIIILIVLLFARMRGKPNANAA